MKKLVVYASCYNVLEDRYLFYWLQTPSIFTWSDAENFRAVTAGVGERSGAHQGRYLSG